jgi:hypothetical protein
VCFDSILSLVINRAQRQISFEILERLLHLRQLGVVRGGPRCSDHGAGKLSYDLEGLLRVCFGLFSHLQLRHGEIIPRVGIASMIIWRVDLADPARIERIRPRPRIKANRPARIFKPRMSSKFWLSAHPLKTCPFVFSNAKHLLQPMRWALKR